MSLIGILLVVLIVSIIAAAPVWGYSRGWGYYPSLGLVALIVVLLLATGGRI